MHSILISGLDQAVQTLIRVYRSLGQQTPVAIAIVVVGLICCFLGFRLTRFVCALGGAVVGGGLCAFVATSYLPVSVGLPGAAVAGVVGALLVGYLFFHLYHVMLFLVCAAIGGLLGSIPATAAGLSSSASGMLIFAVVVLACAVLFGTAGLLFFKPVVILLTSFGGGLLAAPQILWLAGMNGAVLVGVLGAVLGILGAVVQFITSRKRTKPGFGREKSRGSEEEDDGLEMSDGSADLQYHEVEEIIEPPFMAADALNEQWRKNLFLRFLMFICPVFAVLGAVAMIVLGSTHFELVLIFAFLCYAGRRYKSLVLTFAILFGYSAYYLATNINLIGLRATLDTAQNAAACALFLILMLISLRLVLRSRKKKVTRRVMEDEMPTSEIDSLEATRPLTEEDVNTVLETRPMMGEEAAAFAPGVPEDFRQTQEQIFEAANSIVDDGMPAEPDELEETIVNNSFANANKADIPLNNTDDTLVL